MWRTVFEKKKKIYFLCFLSRPFSLSRHLGEAVALEDRVVWAGLRLGRLHRLTEQLRRRLLLLVVGDAAHVALRLQLLDDALVLPADLVRQAAH